MSNNLIIISRSTNDQDETIKEQYSSKRDVIELGNSGKLKIDANSCDSSAVKEGSNLCFKSNKKKITDRKN